MLFQGPTKYKSESEFLKFGESIGVKYNGAVSNYDSTYWFKCPSSKLEEIIYFVSDFLINPALREEDIEKTRSIIISELLGEASSSESQYINRAVELMFGRDSPYSLRAFGEVETVKKIKREDLLNTYKKYYRPENIKLVLTGEFDEHKAEFFINKYFGGWKSGGNPITYPKIKWACKTSPKMFVYNDSCKHASYDLIFPCMGFMQQTLRESYVQDLVSYLLSGGLNSIIYKRLRGDLGLVYSVHSDFSRRPYAGLFGIYTSSEAEQVKIVLREIYKSLKKVLREGFHEQEFVSARNYINMNVYLDFSGLLNVASILFGFIINGDDIYMPEDSESLRNTISLEEVNRCLANLINFQKARLMIFGHKSKLNLQNIRKDFLFCKV